MDSPLAMKIRIGGSIKRIGKRSIGDVEQQWHRNAFTDKQWCVQIYPGGTVRWNLFGLRCPAPQWLVEAMEVFAWDQLSIKATLA